MNERILISVILFFMTVGVAVAGLQAQINFGGESGRFQLSGADSQMIVEQADGTKNLIINKAGKVYVGNKPPGGDWSVFDPSAIGAGFTPPSQPDTEIKLEKGKKASVAGFSGYQYKVTSRQGSEVRQGQAILSDSKAVRKFSQGFTDLVSAMQTSVRGGQSAGGGMNGIGDYLKDRDLGMLKFWDEDGTVGFEVLSLEDGVDVGKIELPAQPGSPFAGMGGSGQNGTPQGHVAPTEADIQRQIEELKQQFQQSQVDQANARKQVEAERLEKERLKPQQKQANEASVETASESASDAAVASDSAASPVSPTGDDIGKKIGDLLKGWGR